MRILHTADWHLGRQLHGVSLIQDQAAALEQLFAAISDTKPDCVLIAGDIFDRAAPAVEAVSLFNDALTRLARDFRGPVLAIAGNHDSPERIDFGSAIFARSNIFIRGTLTAAPAIVPLEDKHGYVDFFLLPFLEPETARHVFGDAALHTHAEALRAGCAGFFAAARPGSRRVAVAHAFVDGGAESESERPLTVGGSGRIPAASFEGFHYAALGHLHQPQSHADNRVRYSGSLFKYSFSEAEHRKSFTLIELAEDGAVGVTELPLSFGRDLRCVRGSFAELMAPADTAGRDDYLLFEITDSGAIVDAMGQLRTLYPNVLQIQRVGIDRALDEGAPRLADLKQDQGALFGEFLEYVTGAAPEAGQVEAFERAAGELMRDDREMELREANSN